MKRVRTAHWLILFITLLAGCTRSSSDSDGFTQRETHTQCGVERWDVKTMTDPAAARVNLVPATATLEQLTALPVPAEFSRDAERLPAEFQTYTEAQVASARRWFVDLFGQPSRTSWIEANVPVTVTGVLFFDVHHGQVGVAPNAVELHPVFQMGP